MNSLSEQPTLKQVILSVLAAMFGVQNSKRLERDFTHGKPWIFIMVGLVAVILFVLSLYGLVHWIVKMSQ